MAQASRPLTREERIRARDAAFRRKQRERERPNAPARSAEAARLAEENASALEERGGDPRPFRRRARRLRLKAAGLDVTQRVTRSRPRPRAFRPRSRARRVARRGSTRAGPGDDGGSEPEPGDDVVAGRHEAVRP